MLPLLNKGILLSPHITVERAQKGVMELGHLPRSVRDFCDADLRSYYLKMNRHTGIINNIALRVISLGDDLEDAVLEVFASDRPVIKQSNVGARGV